MTTRTAAAVGEKPITRALWPDVLLGLDVKQQRVRIGHCLVSRLHRDLVPGPHVILAVLPVDI